MEGVDGLPPPQIIQALLDVQYLDFHGQANSALSLLSRIQKWIDYHQVSNCLNLEKIEL